jgi:hypothetical protein
MFKTRVPNGVVIRGWFTVLTVLLAPMIATSATYTFTGGTAQVTAVLQGTTTSVLEPGTSPVSVSLGGSFVDFDPFAGPNGTITGLELIPNGNFNLDLDQTVSGFDLIQIAGAMLVEDPGATGAVSGGGSFSIDTILSATITGIGGPPPATFVSSLQSGTTGLMGVSGDTLTLGLFGINLATFESLTTPGVFIDVKADFSFVGTVIPEPTSAMLIGLGLAGLAAAGRAARKH